MTRPSTIDDLPDAIRSEIGRLRTQGATIDRIVEHLRGLVGEAPSRSAVGRHVKKLEEIGERLRRTRAMAEGLRGFVGDASMSDMASVSFGLLQGKLFDLLTEAESEDGERPDADSVGGVKALAQALDHLTRAGKTNVEFLRAAETRAAERARAEAAEIVESIGKTAGITRSTMDAIKAGIFGVKA